MEPEQPKEQVSQQPSGKGSGCLLLLILYGAVFLLNVFRWPTQTFIGAGVVAALFLLTMQVMVKRERAQREEVREKARQAAKAEKPPVPSPQETHPAGRSSPANPVRFVLSDNRTCQCGEKKIELNQGSTLSGTLTLKTTDGPWNIREYNYPSFLDMQFEFSLPEDPTRTFRYQAELPVEKLWAPNGTQVAYEMPEFEDQVGDLEELIDWREDWSYLTPEGETHTNRLKYTSATFQVMIETDSLLVCCEYYDQNEDITDYVTIFYRVPLANILLLPDHIPCYREDGSLDDMRYYEGESISLHRI